MRRLLFDLNVVLDVILDRPPGADAAAALWGAIERGEAEGMVPAHGITTVYYLLRKAHGARFAHQATERLLQVFQVAAVDDKAVRRALALGWPDFEDAVCAAAAELAGCDVLVTRDPRGFTHAPLTILEPATALAWLLKS